MDVLETLRGNPLFRGVREDDLGAIAARMRCARFPAGSVILEEHGERRGFFILASGNVHVVKGHGRRSARVINALGPGDYFGILSLLDGSSPSATVLAATGTECLVLPEEDFAGLLARHRSIGASFLSHLSGLLRRQEDAETRERLAAQEAVMVSLAALTEHRDENTGAHLERIRHYCRILAGAAAGDPVFREEIDEEFISWIFLASPLHDIGKVGVPDEVLLKQGRLSPEEFGVMQRHPAIGASAIRGALRKIHGTTFLTMAHDIALCHHEWVDGSGYPARLRGEEIPLSARIMAIADVYDALRSTRVYRKALPHEETRGIMLEGRGRQFDERLLDLFFAGEEALVQVSEALGGTAKQDAGGA